MGAPENEFGTPIIPQEETWAGEYAQPDSEDEDHSTSSSASSTGDDADNLGANLVYPLPVKLIGGQAVERDQLMQCSQELSDHLRARPTLPASAENHEVSFADVETAM